MIIVVVGTTSMRIATVLHSTPLNTNRESVLGWQYAFVDFVFGLWFLVPFFSYCEK